MKIKCDFCGNEFDEELSNCPSCGAVNNNVKKTAESGVRTLKELSTWFYDTMGLNSETTHIYIEKNVTEKAVFGIYKDPDTNDFVVYKNKDTGERAIRYQGKDEQYAVNEMYQLIQRQALRNGIVLNGAKKPGVINNRNDAINNANNNNNNYNSTSSKPGCGCLFTLIMIILISAFLSAAFKGGNPSSNSTSNYDSNAITDQNKGFSISDLAAIYYFIGELFDGVGSSDDSYDSDYDSYDSDGGSWDIGDWGSDWGLLPNITSYSIIRM